VQAALANLMQGRTVVVIAHRLSTIRRANRIAVLEDGRITAVGSHEGLLNASPTYQRLYQLQFHDMPEPAALDPVVQESAPVREPALSAKAGE
jgi:subfamily B ATP-binding cassette protein MsbA